MKPTIHKGNPIRSCPFCESPYSTVDIEMNIIGRTENGDPVPYYLVTFRCSDCHQKLFMEGRSMDAIYKQWEELRKEIAKINPF